jgi:hypothetical protein
MEPKSLSFCVHFKVQHCELVANGNIPKSFRYSGIHILTDVSMCRLERHQNQNIWLILDDKRISI